LQVVVVMLVLLLACCMQECMMCHPAASCGQLAVQTKAAAAAYRIKRVFARMTAAASSGQQQHGVNKRYGVV
jgi:hypothetical protein